MILIRVMGREASRALTGEQGARPLVVDRAAVAVFECRHALILFLHPLNGRCSWK